MSSRFLLRADPPLAEKWHPGSCFDNTIQIYVGPVPGYAVSDLYIGWTGVFSLEAEEVR